MTFHGFDLDPRPPIEPRAAGYLAGYRLSINGRTVATWGSMAAVEEPRHNLARCLLCRLGRPAWWLGRHLDRMART